LSGIKGKKTA